MNKLYNNFFEWYKETQDKWYKETHSIYPDGIDNDTFIYFMEMYLYKGDPNLNHLNKLKYILKKYSKRYKKEYLLNTLLNLNYTYHRKDKYMDQYCFHHKISFDQYYKKEYETSIWPSISDEDYVNYIRDYDLVNPVIFNDPLGTSQINLYYCQEILNRHSFKFRIEKKLFKLFGK